MSLKRHFLRVHWWLKGLQVVGRLVPEPKSIYINKCRRLTFPLFDFKDRREDRGALPVFKEDPQISPPTVTLDIGIDFGKAFRDHSFKSSVGYIMGCGIARKEDDHDDSYVHRMDSRGD